MRRCLVGVLALAMIGMGSIWTVAGAHHKDNRSHNHNPPSPPPPSCSFGTNAGEGTGGADITEGLADYTWSISAQQGTLDYFAISTATVSCPELTYTLFIQPDSPKDDECVLGFPTCNTSVVVTWALPGNSANCQAAGLSCLEADDGYVLYGQDGPGADDRMIADNDESVCAYHEVRDSSGTLLERAPNVGCSPFQGGVSPGRGYN